MVTVVMMAIVTLSYMCLVSVQQYVCRVSRTMCHLSHCWPGNMVVHGAMFRTRPSATQGMKKVLWHITYHYKPRQQNMYLRNICWISIHTNFQKRYNIFIYCHPNKTYLRHRVMYTKFKGHVSHILMLDKGVTFYMLRNTFVDNSLAWWCVAQQRCHH